MRSIGLLPDMILCRSESPLSSDIKKKISLFCNVPYESVFDEVDVETSIYEVPLMLNKQKIADQLCKRLGLEQREADLTDWEAIVQTVKNPKGSIVVGIVGKYLQHQDAYKSVFEALHHGAIANGYQIEIRTIDSENLQSTDEIPECDGYLVPGGFGKRGWEGKILTAQHCRETQTPYFGICLGMQVLVVEYARSQLGLKEANSTEMNAHTPDPLISILETQKSVEEKGGTMRLGSYPCALKSGSKAHLAYGSLLVHERHRHRFEFNFAYKKALEEVGLLFSGTLEGGDLCEITEVEQHPWMMGVQFHPEFQSRPTDAHPLFRSFVQAMIERKEEKTAFSQVKVCSAAS